VIEFLDLAQQIKLFILVYGAETKEFLKLIPDLELLLILDSSDLVNRVACFATAKYSIL
jgi:hypothetical protein